jgi:UDP-N-acetylmuramoyl-tripeptide--D-alanyl-D-alanine ligase
MGIPTPVALTTQLVCEATRGRVTSGESTRVFAGVSTDTRTIGRDVLFIALRGDRFDGHAFTAQAAAQGAGGVLVSAAVEAGPATVIVVDDTLLALQDLARSVRRASGAIVVAITGSAGKTTTKEIAADLLALRYRVFRNAGNLNNHIGLPLSLIELREGPELAVVELGMNHAGEIRLLVDIAEPDVRVWTNVGDAHIGHFGSREAVAAAKAEIFEGATDETLAVVNADDPLVMQHAATFPGPRLTFGESAGADIRATAVIDRGFDGTSANVITPVGTVDLEVPLPGRAHLSNVLAAVAVAVHFGVPLAAIAGRVATLQPVSRRGGSTSGPTGLRVVDDSYNASPAAVHSALTALAATKTSGRRIAVLGEMLELGSSAPALHESCGRVVADLGIDILVAIGGPSVDALVTGAVSAGLPTDRIYRYVDSASAAAAIARLVAAGDLVLVKGSRGSRTDLVADRLREVA